MTNSSLKDKIVLITGGTGSFGKAFAKKLIEGENVKKVIIFSRDEWKQWEMKNENPVFNDPRMRYFLGDVRDEKRLSRAFNEVDIVIHAAALKQVPAAEYNPTEFIKTNIIGAMNVIDAAINASVKQVIALSTDKAVNPVNMYGATKLCSDKLFIAANAYVGKQGIPKLSVVRYGNVAGTRGSIIPFWKHWLETTKKPLPLTDPKMTRFWITLDEAVDFVLKCLLNAHGGEIFVPKIPSFKVSDLAAIMAKERAQEIVGIREGEKIHELMIGLDDARHTLDFGDHFVIMPEALLHTPQLETLLFKKGKTPPEGFAYTSDRNSDWLTGAALRKKVAQVIKEGAL